MIFTARSLNYKTERNIIVNDWQKSHQYKMIENLFFTQFEHI